MRLNYQEHIEESETELLELEKQHRYSYLNQRVKMLRLLKSGRCKSIGAAAKELNYSFRQGHRWLNSYRSGGIAELLENRVSEAHQLPLVETSCGTTVTSVGQIGIRATGRRRRWT